SADVLLVAEDGTDWARWMDELAEQRTPFTAIIQSAEEPLAAFARRIAARIGVLATQRRLPPAVLLLHDHRGPSDARAHRARKEAACAIAGRLAQLDGARLLVATDEQTTPEDV